MNLEYKNLNIDIKQIDDKGTFKGLASPYNNVDFGNDRVMPTAGKRNDSKRVPFLWQHDTHKPIGELILHNTKEGVTVDGTLFLDKDEDGQYMIPKAAEAYVLVKKGILKLSIGYKTLDFEYVVEGKNTVRNLKDIDIMEVSAVTFPMNGKAKITDVKEEGGNKVEEKAMGFADLLKVQQANDLRWKLQDALNMSFRQLMDDENMTVDDKVKQLSQNVDDFAIVYKENMNTLLQASAKSKVAKKEIMDNAEKKERLDSEEIETKAVKTYNCPMCGSSCTSDKNGSCVCGNCGCEFTVDKEGNVKNAKSSKKSNSNENIELKADELELLNKINLNFKIEKGDEV